MSPNIVYTSTPGVVYGFRTLGEYGSYSDGLGSMYVFGRSRSRDMVEFDRGMHEPHADANMKEMLLSRPHHRGLNSPAVILLWARVSDIYEGWDKINNLLKGIYMPRPFEFEEPIITNHLAMGNNYYTVSNVNHGEFGQWVRAHMGV